MGLTQWEQEDPEDSPFIKNKKEYFEREISIMRTIQLLPFLEVLFLVCLWPIDWRCVFIITVAYSCTQPALADKSSRQCELKCSNQILHWCNLIPNITLENECWGILMQSSTQSYYYQLTLLHTHKKKILCCYDTHSARERERERERERFKEDDVTQVHDLLFHLDQDSYKLMLED